MRRREFLALLAAIGAWPPPADAQLNSLPAIGFLSSFPPDTRPKFTGAFKKGLGEAGFVDGQNVSIDYSWAEAGQYDRLPVMAAELIKRNVAVLFATPINAAVAAKKIASTIPVVFAIGSDPVEMHLVATLNEPGGNATGATFLSVELGRKRLELLRDLIPNIAAVALLVNPKNPTTQQQTKDMQAAAATLGLQLRVINVDAQSNLEDTFEALAQQHTDAAVVSADSAYWGLRDQLIASAAHHSLPMVYFAREFAAAGGLLSYNSDYADSIRKAGTYVGRILKGEKPRDLPVLQPTNSS